MKVDIELEKIKLKLSFNRIHHTKTNVFLQEKIDLTKEFTMMSIMAGLMGEHPV